MAEIREHRCPACQMLLARAPISVEVRARCPRCSPPWEPERTPDPTPPPALSAAELEAIAARVQQAPAGPWTVPGYNQARPPRHVYATMYLTIEQTSMQVQVVPFSVGDTPTAEFVAHARQDVPQLLTELRALRAAVAALPEPWQEVNEQDFCYACHGSWPTHREGCPVAALRARVPPAGADHA